MKVLGAIFVLILVMLSSAFVSSTLWGWFLVPLGVPMIGIAHAYGLGVFTTFLTGTAGLSLNMKDSGKEFGEKSIAALLLPWVALLFGYIATLFM